MPPVAGILAPIVAVLGATGTQIAVAVLGTAVRFGLAYYQAEKAKDAAKTAAQDVQQNIRQNVMPRYVVLGKARVGGVVMFYEAVDGYLYVATILSDDIIDSIETFWVKDIECLVNNQLAVTTPPFNSGGTKYVNFELHYGYTDQPASDMLMAAFPGVVTAAHTAAGIAYLVTRLKQAEQEDFQTIYNSSVPPIACLVRGVLAYDPRDPSHNPARSDTWTTTTNPAILLLYYFTANNGFGMSRSLFDGVSFSEVADFCDEMIATKDDGNRRRYQMGGVYSYDTDPADIVQLILDTFGGQIYVTQDGLFGLSCDELDKPEITITQDMVIEGEFKRNTGALYEYTTIKTKFTSENHGYVSGNEEADPWVNNAAVKRVGRQIPYSFDLPFVFRHDQCRRLMKRKFYQLNPEWSVDLAIDFHGIELFGERVCRFVYPPLGIDGTFRIESLAPDGEAGFARMLVKLASISDQAFEWDAATEEGRAPVVAPPTSETDAPQTPTGLAALVGNDGGIVALLTWAARTTGKRQDAQWKLSADSSWTSVTVDRDTREYTLTGLTSGASYDFRVRTKATNYGVSDWATITFTATALVGSTTGLQSLSADGDAQLAVVTAKQSAAATAAYIQFNAVPHGDPASWAGSILKAARADQTISVELPLSTGSWDVYARSKGINGDNSSASGPVVVTVTNTSSGGGTGGTGSGGGGDGGNDGGTGTGTSNGGDGVAPSQQGDNESPSQQGGNGGTGGTGGGIY